MQYQAREMFVNAIQVTPRMASSTKLWPTWLLRAKEKGRIARLWNDKVADNSLIWRNIEGYGVGAIKWHSWLIQEGEDDFNILTAEEFEERFEPIPTVDPKDGRVYGLWLPAISDGLSAGFDGHPRGRVDVKLPIKAAWPGKNSRTWVKISWVKPSYVLE